MQLRQIALVARDLEPAVDTLTSVLGIEVGFVDPGVGVFGLENAVMPVGHTFLEVVSPAQSGTTAGRLLERRGGDGGYMVILQSDDLEADRARIETLGVRIVFEAKQDDITGLHLHPRDVGAAILSIDQPAERPEWPWAGPKWREHVRTERVAAIVGAELQAEDPAALAARWSEVIGLEARAADDGSREIALEGGRLRFVPVGDGRGPGVGGVELRCNDAGAVLDAARERGIETRGNRLELCGTRFDLV